MLDPEGGGSIDAPRSRRGRSTVDTWLCGGASRGTGLRRTPINRIFGGKLNENNWPLITGFRWRAMSGQLPLIRGSRWMDEGIAGTRDEGAKAWALRSKLVANTRARPVRWRREGEKICR